MDFMGFCMALRLRDQEWRRGYTLSKQKMSCLYHCGIMQNPNTSQQHRIRGRPVLCQWSVLVGALSHSWVMAKNSGQGRRTVILRMSLGGPYIFGFHGILHGSEKAESEAIHSSLSNVILYGFMWTQTANRYREVGKKKKKKVHIYWLSSYPVDCQHSWKQLAAHHRSLSSGWMTW